MHVCLDAPSFACIEHREVILPLLLCCLADFNIFGFGKCFGTWHQLGEGYATERCLQDSFQNAKDINLVTTNRCGVDVKY